MANLTASQIAAQAAMQHQASAQHMRKRSQTIPAPQPYPESSTGRRRPNSPPPLPATQATTLAGRRSSGQQYHNGLLGGPTVAAATAANAAFPRSPLPSPGTSSSEHAVPPPEKEYKLKAEKPKMKLFSKPKNIGISRDKELEKKDRPLGSPNKMGTHGPSPLPRMVNASTTSLADSLASGANSMYSSTNASTSTLIPLEKTLTAEKERHKHHFLSRQKHKLKDKDDHHLPLSSASSNSKPLDPSAPQSLYSFAPSSPGPTSTTFAKSMSGLDLRHGGRALREKKKEEKATAAASAAGVGNLGGGLDLGLRDIEPPFLDRAEWPGPSSLGSTAGISFLGPPTASSAHSNAPSLFQIDTSQGSGLQGFGLSGMTPDDAWPFLKAKLLIIFEGEDLRLPVEDFNRLVTAHLQRCIQKRAPTIITEDLHELLHTGFLSLDQTLRNIPDERLVPQLVEMWLFVFSIILPYMQAVFLPLDLEFKGHGIMASQEAAEFWGALPEGENSDTALGEELDVRRIVLISYRDVVILPRHDSLKSIFSRLSLENINAGINRRSDTPESVSGGRPGTAASLDPGFASFTSQGSTLLNDSAASLGARSRAASNTSSNFVPSSPPHIPFPAYHPPLPSQATPDSSYITETVGRMLQCVSVLASVQSGDDAQLKMEGLSKELKHNWLGRGRTGRNRRGFVGTRTRPMGAERRRDDGSPTPTPSAGNDRSGMMGSML
ncbi:MAG: hypothetical protein M1827_005101 [Pycnora praestabilis]|nr:MAG: hypothetical protein M1827_005101 [Pycnora praestabilis]